MKKYEYLKSHMVSLITTLTDLIEYVVMKTEEQSINQSSITVDAFNVSSNSTECLMEKSYEDERKNLCENIKNMMMAKLETVQTTLPDFDLGVEMCKVSKWQIVTEV